MPAGKNRLNKLEKPTVAVINTEAEPDGFLKTVIQGSVPDGLTLTFHIEM